MNKMCGDISDEKDQATMELEGLRSQQELLRTDRIRSTEDLAYWQGQHKGASDTFYEMQQRLLAKGGTYTEIFNILFRFTRDLHMQYSIQEIPMKGMAGPAFNCLRI